MVWGFCLLFLLCSSDWPQTHHSPASVQTARIIGIHLLYCYFLSAVVTASFSFSSGYGAFFLSNMKAFSCTPIYDHRLFSMPYTSKHWRTAPCCSHWQEAKGLKSVSRNTSVLCSFAVSAGVTLQPKREAKVHRSGAAQALWRSNRIPCVPMLT